MKTVKSTIETEIITTEDGNHTYEVIKRLVDADGDCGYLISLYPTKNEANIFAPDSTLSHITAHMQDLGLKELHIISLFSKVVDGKMSVRGLEIDKENMEYISKLMTDKKFKSSKFIIAWGNSLLSSLAVNESKAEIFKMFHTHNPKAMLYQLTTIGRNLECDITPHPLYLGIRGGRASWGLKEFKLTEQMLKSQTNKQLKVANEK